MSLGEKVLGEVINLSCKHALDQTPLSVLFQTVFGVGGFYLPPV